MEKLRHPSRPMRSRWLWCALKRFRPQQRRWRTTDVRASIKRRLERLEENIKAERAGSMTDAELIREVNWNIEALSAMHVAMFEGSLADPRPPMTWENWENLTPAQRAATRQSIEA